jgi:uncharacterized membrane protein YozB (DUF420 family)
MMLTSSALVGLFLATYVVKVALLGRENLSTWGTGSLWLLYVHEACVAAMLVGGAVAVTRARRFGRLWDGERLAPNASERDRRLHRLAGRVAVATSLVALATAAGVLVGMYSRAAP